MRLRLFAATLAVILPSAVLGLSPHTAVAASREAGGNLKPATCARTFPAAARPVLKALSQERLAWFRRQYGLTHLNAKSLRPLRANDLSVCARIDAELAARPPVPGEGWSTVYYLSLIHI